MTEFKIRKRAPTCCVSGRPFAPGDVIVSVIHEEDDGFVRRDMHEEFFAQEEAEAFCVWRTRQPEPPAPPRRLDLDFAQKFFDRLLREADPAREGLLYTLALLLARKRRVKIRDARPLPEGELLKVVVPRAEEDEVHAVRAPRLSAEDVDRLQKEIEELFDLPGQGPAQEPRADGAVGENPTFGA